ncbi:hypothetical protein GGI12_001637, partial [Dipsacomyces acuminosporus]
SHAVSPESAMFGFKKSKGRKNIRRKDEGATPEVAAEDHAADIVKRSSKPSAKQESAVTNSPGLSFGVDQSAGEFIEVKKSRASAKIKGLIAEQRAQDTEQTKYTAGDIQSLKKETEKAALYPFSNEGIPNAHEIYMAKKLRRQRQAELRMEDVDDSVDTIAMHNDDEEFISLTDDLANSKIASSELRDFMDDGATEGEDEEDAVIIGKNDRQEYASSSRRAKEEAVGQAQEEDESSDWENEQLRNAGVAPLKPHSADARSTRLPVDRGGFEFDGSFLNFLLAQEKNQLGIERDRLETVQRDVERTREALGEIQKESEVAQKQWDHFTAMSKSA